MVEKSETESVNFLANCHAGRNRSPVLMAIIYFACLLQQKSKQKLSKEEIIAQLGKSKDQTLAEKLTTELAKLRELVGSVKWQFVHSAWDVQLKRIWQNFIENMDEFSSANKRKNIFSTAKPDEFAVKTDKLLSILHDQLASQAEALGGFGILKMFNAIPNACKDFFEELLGFSSDGANNKQAALAKYLILADAKKQVRQASDIKQLDEIVDKLSQHQFLQSLHPVLKQFVSVMTDTASAAVNVLANSLTAVINAASAARTEVAGMNANAGAAEDSIVADAVVGTSLKLN